MRPTTEIERRDRALIAFAILTGARDRAIVSFRLKHIDIGGLVEQDAREVRTKRAGFSRPGSFRRRDIQKIVVDWVASCTRKGFGPEDPIFPKSKVATGATSHSADGLERAPWANANPVRAVFKEAFARAGLPYSIRTHFATRSSDSLMNSISRPNSSRRVCQNPGHDDCLTGFFQLRNAVAASAG